MLYKVEHMLLLEVDITMVVFVFVVVAVVEVAVKEEEELIFPLIREKNGKGSSSGIRGKAFNNRDKSKVQCYKCKRFGHFASKCRSKLQRHQDEQANVAEVEQPLILVYKQGADTEANNIWYLETAYSNHMTG